MASAGVIIYKAFMPTLKMVIGISVGFAMAKSGVLTPQCAKGLSIVALNISLPCLIFASVVPAFNQSNISAFGPLALAAIFYEVIGAAFGWVVREIFYVPMDFQWGIIVMGALSNWANLPIAVVQTVGNDAPFNNGDVELGVAYISVFSLIFCVILFPLGLHKVCALDFKEENLNRPAPLPFRPRWQKRFRKLQRTLRRSNSPSEVGDEIPEKKDDVVPSQAPEVGLSRRDSEEGKHLDERGEEPGSLRESKAVYRGGAAPLRVKSKTPSFTSMIETTKPIPPTAPLDAVDINRSACIPGPSAGGPLLPVCSNHGQAYSYHEPQSPVPSIHRPAARARLISILKSFLMPVTMAIIVSIPCALIQPLKALFTSTPGWTGTRMPNGLDGKPPLYFFLETCAFIGGICIPGGLILLGASFARLKGALSWKGQPIGAIWAMAILKMIVMPVIGVFFVRNQTGIFPPEDRMRTFVCVLLSGTPAAVNQLVVTQLYNPEGTANTLSRFLLLQYILMPILSTTLAGVALYVCSL